jgi:hypothetical protein
MREATIMSASPPATTSTVSRWHRPHLGLHRLADAEPLDQAR